MRRAASLVALVLLIAAAPSRTAAPGVHVEMTWMSIANWYFQIGGLRIVMDGYITRVPEKIFVPSRQYPNDRYTFTTQPWKPNVADVRRVRDAISSDGRLDFVLAGHSHFDHTYDVATWALLTGARIIGSQSTCYQAQAQGVPASQCTVVSGSWVTGRGERIDLGHGVTLRVVRFNHSGDASNPYQHFGRELKTPPHAVNGGLRAGVAEDFPNGGGSRGYLFTVDNPGGRKLSFFVNDSASAFDLTKPVTADGLSYGSPLANLAAAMRDAGLTSVDAWIATGSAGLASMIVPVIHPKVYIPNHWDGFFNSMWRGLPYPFSDKNLSSYLSAHGIRLVPQTQYFDLYQLDAVGVSLQPNLAVKQKLGFTHAQAFAPATHAAVKAFEATVPPDDCQE